MFEENHRCETQTGYLYEALSWGPYGGNLTYTPSEKKPP